MKEDNEKKVKKNLNRSTNKKTDDVKNVSSKKKESTIVEKESASENISKKNGTRKKIASLGNGVKRSVKKTKMVENVELEKVVIKPNSKKSKTVSDKKRSLKSDNKLSLKVQKKEKSSSKKITDDSENLDKILRNRNKKFDNKDKVNLNNNIFSLLFSKVSCVIIGFLMCILLFFILSGGRNYLKLYYELREFIEVYDVVTSDYYGKLDKDYMISGAIDAMLVNVDDYYTTYLDKNSTDTFLEDVNGTYVGIGCMISTNVNGEIFVVEVFDDSPSSEAGLKEEDIILKVNNEDYSNKTSLDMSEYVKNNDLKEIVLTVKREEEIFDVTIKRQKVEIPVVNSQIFEYNDKKVGYISIDVFSSISYEQIKSKLKKLEKKDITGLVIDVRGNNGGYLSAVTDITNLFLEKGEVIYQLEDNKSLKKVKDSTKEFRDYPIAVLTNAGSASASEIFASAIKESYGGFVVGTNTYGKGTVQKTKVLHDGSMVKYTIQKWLTPNGNFVNEIGLEPTHIVELVYDNGNDSQLVAALELVTEDKE